MIHFFEHISFSGWLVIGVVAVLFLVRTYFYLLQIRLIRFNSLQLKRDLTPPVSVIIAAKNEAENLQKFLPAILEQDYPEYEVIVVDDGSNDQTTLILETFKKKYPHLKSTYIKPDKQFRHGKKLAVTIGIKAAAHDFFVFTDADCKTVSKKWLRLMSRNFKTGDLILGFGGYQKEKSFLNKLVRYETIQIAILYFTKALQGKPYMGVGRNLAYTRALYSQVKGFSSHYHIPTGDDDLFVNEASRQGKTVIETHPESFTVSVPPASFREWQRQKSRHLSGSKFYSWGQKFFLGIESLSRGIFHLIAIPGIFFYPEITFPVLVFLLLDFLGKYTISAGLFRHFGGKDIIIFTFFFDIIITFLVFVRLLLNIFTRQNRIWS